MGRREGIRRTSPSSGCGLYQRAFLLPTARPKTNPNPQSGKSSLINSLARKSTLPVYKLSSSQDGPTTTIYPQEVTLEVGGKTLRLVDTPGFTWLPPTEISVEDAVTIRSRDILVRNKGRIDRLKDPEPVGERNWMIYPVS